MANQNNNHAPGVPCPQCKNRIPVSIPILLAHSAIFCNNCGIKLTIDKENSQDGLEQLEKLHKAMENVQKVKDNPMG